MLCRYAIYQCEKWYSLPVLVLQEARQAVIYSAAITWEPVYVASCHQHGPAWNANGPLVSTHNMCLRKSKPLINKFIQVRRADFFVSQRMNGVIALVVTVNNQDVLRFLSKRVELKYNHE